MAGRLRQHLVSAGAALVLATAPLGTAVAEQIIHFMPPAAQAFVVSYQDISGVRTGTVANLTLFNACPANEVRYANYALGGGFASAQAGRGVGHFAMAGGSDLDGGLAEASLWMFIKDPQNRATVKLDVKINGYALSHAPDGASPVTTANYILSIGKMKGTPSAVVLDDGCTVKRADAIFDWLDSLYMITGFDSHQLDIYGNVHTSSGLNTYINGVLTEQGTQSYQPISRTFEVVPNQGGHVIVVRASAGGGVAAIDPVITAHADNPDVEVEIGVPDVDTGRRPLDGFTAEDLTALGLDPQPFVDLGFLAPTSEPPPPPPPAPVTKDWCGPGFWKNNAVKFGASAWPQPTYYDYNSTAGQRAGCPVAAGNPTLLQVLQNPSLYFSTQSMGAGYNCVADYLSAKSGLPGTAVDNNGVCSIDQSGAHTS